MSFISILKKVGGVVGTVEHVAVPIVSALYPPAAGFLYKFDDAVQKILHGIATVEVDNPVGGGELKQAAVIADFEAGLEFTQGILAIEHKHLVYDKTELQGAITDLVSGFNRLSKVKGSFKVEPIP